MSLDSNEPGGLLLKETGLPTRLINVLARAGIRTVRQAAYLTDFQLWSIDGFGAVSHDMLREWLVKHGYREGPLSEEQMAEMSPLNFLDLGETRDERSLPER